MSYDTESKSRNILASPLGEEGHEVAKGVQANWIHRGAPRPANPVRRHPAKSVCTRVRMIMTLDMDVTAERRHYKTHCPLKGSLCTASLRGPPIGGQDSDGVSNRRSALYTLCLFEAFPSRGNEKYGEEKQRVIYFMYHFGVSPFGGWRHHLSPASGGTITRAYCRAIYEESVSRCFILPPPAGEVRRSRIGGGERSEPISRMLIKSYDTVR